jgi:hypothetical protein
MTAIECTLRSAADVQTFRGDNAPHNENIKHIHREPESNAPQRFARL